MDNNKFWLYIWITVAVSLSVPILTIGGCTAYETAKVAEMVAKGADPVAARCAMGWTGSVSAPIICAITNRQ